MAFEEYKEDLCTHYVCAIEYGDLSALTKTEIKQVKEFLNTYPKAHFQYGEESYFERDVITGLHADCIELTIFIPIKE